MFEIFDNLLKETNKVDNEKVFENQLNLGKPVEKDKKIVESKKIKEAEGEDKEEDKEEGEKPTEKDKHTVFNKFEYESSETGTYYALELYRDEKFIIYKDDKVIAEGDWGGAGVMSTPKGDTTDLCQLIFDIASDRMAKWEKPVDEYIDESKKTNAKK